GNAALRALGAPGDANVSSVQNQPMVSILQEGFGNQSGKLLFYLIDCLAGGDACAVGYPKNMRVDGNNRVPKGRVQYDIGGFPAHAGQRLKGCAVIRNLALMFFNQDLAGAYDVGCLGAIQAYCPNGFSQAIQS